MTPGNQLGPFIQAVRPYCLSWGTGVPILRRTHDTVISSERLYVYACVRACSLITSVQRWPTVKFSLKLFLPACDLILRHPFCPVRVLYHRLASFPSFSCGKVGNFQPLGYHKLWCLLLKRFTRLHERAAVVVLRMRTNYWYTITRTHTYISK